MLSPLKFAFAAPLALCLAAAAAAQPVIKPEMPAQLMPPAPVAATKGKVIQVGPARAVKLPSEASKLAGDGDVVEIDAGEYPGDVAAWKQSNLTVRAVGGLAVLRALGRSMQGKAIWVVDGDNVRIENIEFAESHVPDLNGAGIRAQGGSLTVVGCVFRDSDTSILTVVNPQADLVVERSEFAGLGHPGGRAHGIYVGGFRSARIIGSAFHDTNVGHHIKSRAGVTIIAYNRITTGDEGKPSYEIEMPNGGLGIVLGNLIQQGKRSDNSGIIAHTTEGGSYADNRLFVVNNTIVNDLGKGIFVRTLSGPATVANNVLLGGGLVLEGPGALVHNLLVEHQGGAPNVYGDLNGGKNRGNVTTKDAALVDLAALDARPRKGSPALGAGVNIAAALGVPLLRPDFAPAKPLGLEPRSPGSLIDVGAFAAGN